jgi:ribosomal protein L7Ae-like RNA K-turn-binding protein
VSGERFPKAFRAKCSVSGDLSYRIQEMLRREARQLLALANKAGLVAIGFEQTAEALRDGRTRLLIEALDGAENGLRKLRVKRTQGCEIVAFFDSNELGLALGRANVIHAAVARGALAEKLLGAVERAESFDAEPA